MGQILIESLDKVKPILEKGMGFFIREEIIYIGIKNIYKRFIWLDEKVEAEAYPNAIAFADKFGVSIEMAQR